MRIIEEINISTVFFSEEVTFNMRLESGEETSYVRRIENWVLGKGANSLTLTREGKNACLQLCERKSVCL